MENREALANSILDVVKAQAGIKQMSPTEIVEMTTMLAQKMETFIDPVKEAEVEQEQQPQIPAVDPKKSIRQKSIVCLECGKVFKVITKKHLLTHGLTPEEYKEKWGLKKDKSLACRELVKARRDKMKEMRLWERIGEGNRGRKKGGTNKPATTGKSEAKKEENPSIAVD